MVPKVRTSGSEPTCTKAPFGTTQGIPSNNCTAYSYQVYSTRPGFKLQPGELAGKRTDFSLSTCSPVTRRVIEDLRARGLGYPADPDRPCIAGHAKVMLFLDPNTDYHFLRQNGDVVYPATRGETRVSIAAKFRVPVRNVLAQNDGPYRQGQLVRVVKANVWSHKRGTAFPPTLLDAKGQLIFDPRYANLNYGDYDYSKYCAAFCIKQKPCPRRQR